MSNLAVPLADFQAYGCPVKDCAHPYSSGRTGQPCGGAVAWVCPNRHLTVGIFGAGVSVSPIYVDGAGYPPLFAHPKSNGAPRGVVLKIPTVDEPKHWITFPDGSIDRFAFNEGICVVCGEDINYGSIWRFDNRNSQEIVLSSLKFPGQRSSLASAPELRVGACTLHQNKLDTLKRDIKIRNGWTTVRQIREALSL